MFIVVMAGILKIPIFPLGILPIPKEMIPLHIFEPRYRQLLSDLKENEEMIFGILLDHPLNKDHLGAIVRLESILKEYDSGETDIVVKCISNFVLDKYYSRFNDKSYPAGEVIPLKNSKTEKVSHKLEKHYQIYANESDGTSPENSWEIHDLANMLHLELNDRMSYIKQSGDANKEKFLHRLIEYHLFILEQEKKSHSNFHLN